MGRVWPKSNARTFLRVIGRDPASDDGLLSTISEDGSVMGTFLHGFWDNDAFRHKFIEYLLKRKKKEHVLPNLKLISYAGSIEKAIQEIAQVVKDQVDIEYIANIMWL